MLFVGRTRVDNILFSLVGGGRGPAIVNQMNRKEVDYKVRNK